MSIEKAVTDAALSAAKLTEVSLRKAWSLMDAARENARPSEVLSPRAVQAIQGVLPTPQD
jgi:hypothetical protein